MLYVNEQSRAAVFGLSAESTHLKPAPRCKMGFFASDGSRNGANFSVTNCAFEWTSEIITEGPQVLHTSFLALPNRL
ncbi:MAG TPA: hypothetical protein VFK65_24770, partial [Candidatus Binatia bacterium]|nr:hypothetical protein [Candidatus Binatia bacterium]